MINQIVYYHYNTYNNHVIYKFYMDKCLVSIWLDKTIFGYHVVGLMIDGIIQIGKFNNIELFFEKYEIGLYEILLSDKKKKQFKLWLEEALIKYNNWYKKEIEKDDWYVKQLDFYFEKLKEIYEFFIEDGDYKIENLCI